MLRIRMGAVMGSVGLILLALSVAVSAEQAAKPSKGEAIFKSKCASCHGIDAKAATKVGKMMQTPDLTKTPWKHGSTQADVEKITCQGFKKMPKFEGKLTAEEITAVSEHLRTLCKVQK